MPMAKLYFYYSSMNAGKSTALLQSSYNYKERGMNTLVLAPLLDDRYGAGKVTSRIGIETDATVFKRDDDLFAVVEQCIAKDPLHCVLIDEAQFLTRDQVFEDFGIYSIEPLIDEEVIMACSDEYYEQEICGDHSFANLAAKEFISYEKSSLTLQNWFKHHFNKFSIRTSTIAPSEKMS